MISIEYVVLFLLLAVVLFAAIYFTMGIDWFGPGKYGELMSCCSKYRMNDCNTVSIMCDGDRLDTLIAKQNVSETQLKDMCKCGVK